MVSKLLTIFVFVGASCGTEKRPQNVRECPVMSYRRIFSIWKNAKTIVFFILFSYLTLQSRHDHSSRRMSGHVR
jgi:hypothetical protein